MLKITKASEPIHVSRLVSCIYGPPGIGKSTLAFTASRPLLLDFDRGVHRAAHRGDAVRVETWGDVERLNASDLEPYDTIVVDTAGRALDLLSLSIIEKDPKKGNSGALTLQGFGVLKSSFAGWLSLLNSIGKDVVLVAHLEEKPKGDDIIERIDIQGGSKGEVYKSSDAMGRLSLVNGRRTLTFSPSDTAFGKNPGNLEALFVPDPAVNPAFLAEVLQSIKDRLNTLSEDQRKAQAELEDLRSQFVVINSAAGFDGEVARLADAPTRVKTLLVAVAKEKGFWFDKSTRRFMAPVEKAS